MITVFFALTKNKHGFFFEVQSFLIKSFIIDLFDICKQGSLKKNILIL